VIFSNKIKRLEWLKKYRSIFFPLYTKEILLVLLTLSGLCIFHTATLQEPARVIEIERPNYKESNESKLVYYYLGKGKVKEQEIKLSLGEGTVEKSEIRDYLYTVSKQLEGYIKSQNSQFKKIEAKLALPDSYEKCRVIYEIHPLNLIDDKGWFNLDQWGEQEEIQISYVISIETEAYENQFKLLIEKAAFSDTYYEAFIQNRIEAAWQENSLDKDKKSVELPKEVDFYDAPKPLNALYLIAGIFILATCLSLLSRGEMKLQEIHFKKLKRIQLTYLINNFILFFQTGMTIQKSFLFAVNNRIEVLEESKELKDQLKDLLNSVKQENDFSSIMELFLEIFPFSEGRRFVRLLLQNMRQGDHLLAEQLQQLTSTMWEERIRRARKESEKASSKLMLPMVLIFIIILVITIVPTLIEVQNYL
jgi:tight adherence protein C